MTTGPPPGRTWGFRFSVTDGVVIVGTLVLTVLAWPYSPLFALLPPIVLGHFFLFCNVFRIHRQRELLWAGVFIVNTVVWWFGLDAPSWAGVLAVQTPLTALLIGLEMYHPRYHGIVADRVNPRLDSYLKGEIE